MPKKPSEEQIKAVDEMLAESGIKAEPEPEQKRPEVEAEFEKKEPLTWADRDGGAIDTINDVVNPFNNLTPAEKDRLRVSRVLRARQKVRCLMTRQIGDKLYLLGVKRPRANQQTFFWSDFTYHLDVNKVVIMAMEPYLIYEENTAEPLELKMGKITGSSSIELDLIKRSEIVKQVFRGLAGGGTKTDIMMYVMMGVVAVAAFMIGYVLGTGGISHIGATTPPPKVTTG